MFNAYCSLFIVNVRSKTAKLISKLRSKIMSHKITTSLLLVLLIFSFNSSYSQNRKAYNNIVLDGSEVGNANTGSNVQTSNTDNNYEPLSVNAYTVHYFPFSLSSYYDLQSNGTPNEIWQDPLNPLYVHAAVMVMPTFGSTRFVNYLLSTNRGQTWDNFGNVAEAQSGFPSIDGLSDGAALITMHTTAGGIAEARSQVFADLGAGFGTFDRLDPGQNAGGDGIWGRIIATGSITDPNKYVLAASQNAGLIAATINGTSLTPPGTFGAWQNFPSENAEQYCLALGQDGRIGNAFISDVNIGDVLFRESFNGGVTWTNPVTIFDANVFADSLGAFRGISMVYLQNTPCVTFEVDYITESGYFPGLPSTIRYWNPTVNGGVPKIIASQANVPFAPNLGPNGGVMTPICRPAIGKTNSSSGQILFLAMNVATSLTSADSNTYYAAYFTYSDNGGNTWVTPERITPVTPLKDYRYVSLSHLSNQNESGTYWKVQLVVQSHDYAGVFAPSQPPGPSDFVSMVIDLILGGVNEISNLAPNSFSLEQNYPNPFNPVTNLEFGISDLGFVSLKVYDILGKEVTTLVNEKLSPGNYKVEFDGNEFPSGVYFYRLVMSLSNPLTAVEFTDTKRMLLLK